MKNTYEGEQRVRGSHPKRNTHTHTHSHIQVKLDSMDDRSTGGSEAWKRFESSVTAISKVRDTTRKKRRSSTLDRNRFIFDDDTYSYRARVSITQVISDSSDRIALRRKFHASTFARANVYVKLMLPSRSSYSLKILHPRSFALIYFACFSSITPHRQACCQDTNEIEGNHPQKSKASRIADIAGAVWKHAESGEAL